MGPVTRAVIELEVTQFRSRVGYLVLVISELRYRRIISSFLVLLFNRSKETEIVSPSKKGYYLIIIESPCKPFGFFLPKKCYVTYL